ncbi:hypothetical protein E3Q23_00301 [Wallemia mellicola]|uniref:Uncharacterized protein n=1 Tax=Wallemia mellicola TaxID=1708541 RepID=A0A4T0M9B9_9BASI|nr:hypothetical protein E3Q23_00301 [Wallemia mellicola]TIB91261.1 hypothetical protein E3Q19_02501 [Wallemia mellicola]TIC29985.1 hypothetical protein E3Q11_01154 [Wallemia mellicola]TIC34197.1 hypothetical protein E3Q10_00312 [Wallemia mellicola]TIC75208.1 hypothetical protein E3Q00_01135 [Wallemia mellicola]
MVITRKSRPELESDIRRVKSEITSLERQLQARETQSRFDDDLDDEEELEEILKKLAAAGESDALSALLQDNVFDSPDKDAITSTEGVDSNGSNTDSQNKSTTINKQQDIETQKQIHRFNAAIQLNQAFTGISIDQPTLLQEDQEVRDYRISGIIQSLGGIPFDTVVQFNTKTLRVTDLKINCPISGLHDAIKRIEDQHSLPLFYRTLHDYGGIVQHLNALMDELHTLYHKNVIYLNEFTIVFGDYTKRTLMLTCELKWDKPNNRLEPSFFPQNLTVLEETASAKELDTIANMNINFQNMLVIGIPLKKAIEIALTAWLHMQQSQPLALPPSTAAELMLKPKDSRTNKEIPLKLKQIITKSNNDVMKRERMNEERKKKSALKKASRENAKRIKKLEKIMEIKERRRAERKEKHNTDREASKRVEGKFHKRKEAEKLQNEAEESRWSSSNVVRPEERNSEVSEQSSKRRRSSGSPGSISRSRSGSGSQNSPRSYIFRRSSVVDVSSEEDNGEEREHPGERTLEMRKARRMNERLQGRRAHETREIQRENDQASPSPRKRMTKTSPRK